MKVVWIGVNLLGAFGISADCTGHSYELGFIYLD